MQNGQRAFKINNSLTLSHLSFAEPLCICEPNWSSSLIPVRLDAILFVMHFFKLIILHWWVGRNMLDIWFIFFVYLDCWVNGFLWSDCMLFRLRAHLICAWHACVCFCHECLCFFVMRVIRWLFSEMVY